MIRHLLDPPGLATSPPNPQLGRVGGAFAPPAPSRVKTGDAAPLHGSLSATPHSSARIHSRPTRPPPVAAASRAVHAAPEPGVDDSLPAPAGAAHPNLVVLAGHAPSGSGNVPGFCRRMTRAARVATTSAVRGGGDV
ncbi:MAG: hypothetical protein JW751_13655 [Polyangiaceae bacterium]|nr:hypothetical protein [Polyangiaceae bacterium]